MLFMTKEQFLKYDKENIVCDKCNRLLPIKYFSYSYIKLNGTGRCKSCDWEIRHNGIPKIEGFTEHQIKIVIDFLIFEQSIYLNDLADILDIDLPDVIRLVQSLKVGNKKYLIKTMCAYCGKEIGERPRIFLSNRYCYCNYDCYWKHKPIADGNGKDNWQYNRIKTQCTNCKKDIEVIPYNFGIKNAYGDNHNFCSQQCYWEYRSKYYVGDKSPSYNRVITDEQRERMRETILKNSRNADRFNSSIQLCVNGILDKNNINYEREFIIKYYAVDNYLIDYNLIIEVMGDYWHTSPLKYNENHSMISELQKRGIKTDKSKHTYIQTHNNIEILYLWEHDIQCNPDLCEALILSYIKNKGVLQNYHSFNWSYVNNTLSLNSELIIPYQDMAVDDYRHLIKSK